MPGSPFSLRLEDEMRARLEEEARRAGRPAAQVAVRAIGRYLEAQERFREEIDAALAEAEAGVFISAEAAHAWMEGWGTEAETPPPAPDIRPENVPRG
jgi:predicted transcriptional regulator